jgi:rfaE bifunctional protein kinase chain/domain
MTVLENIINNASKLKIAVIGDFIEDRYVIGDVDRISPEAPVPVVKVTGQISSSGGAGNVYENLKGMGVKTYLFCDADLTLFSNDAIIYADRKEHCVKTRIMSGGHHIVRFDNEIVPIFRALQDMRWSHIFEAALSELDAVVIADYHKGVVGDDVAENVINLCNKHNVPVIVDAKRDFGRFEGATIFKCNGKEWDASGYTPTRFLQKLNVGELVVTEGSKGIHAFDLTLSVREDGYKIPITDTCGAGDTVTAILAVCKALKIEIVMTAAGIANRCAAEVCKHPGVYAIQRDDLIKINDEQREKVL